MTATTNDNRPVELLSAPELPGGLLAAISFRWSRTAVPSVMLWWLLVMSVLVPSRVEAGTLVELSSRPMAPDFELEDIGGATHRLSDMKGSVVLVNFWASWCAPCRAEMPSLERLKKRVDSPGFRILAVNLGEKKEDISRFYFSINPPLTFKILMDRDMNASQYWPMKGLPMTFIVDKTGRVTHVSRGARRWDSSEVTDVINSLEAAPVDDAGAGIAIGQEQTTGQDS